MMQEDQESSKGEDFLKQADDLLAEEISRLSFQDRNHINEEIHGVRVLAPEETPELLERSLADLGSFLNQMITEPPSLKDAYNLSQTLDSNRRMEPIDLQSNENPSTTNILYVNDKSFLLRFLRCELFDAKKAALRIIKYLNLVHEVCGEYALTRPIQLNDFNKEEKKILRSGFMQLLPYRDRAGRPILAFVGDIGAKYSWRQKLKVLIYLFYVSGDIESQRKGLVVLCCPDSQSDFSNFSFDGRTKELLTRLVESSSIRFCAIHACMPDTFLFRMRRLFIVGAVSTSVRLRLKFFVATGIERQYIFKGYGIPTELIPITDTGNVKTVFLRQWIKLRTLLESGDCTEATDAEDSGYVPWQSNSSSPLIVEFPASRDVLYRTGTTTSFHPGNVVFRELIESKLEEAQTGSEVSISMLADEVVNNILQTRRGRFLKWDHRGYWTVLNDRGVTNAKVAASIREFKRSKDAKSNMQSVDSSTHIFEGQDSKRRKRLCDD